ncbi:MAG: GntR family transcriptional regulator [Planctomycetes bacterium]|nr:GntR family transcriptional regulator [Planctomycetota bacterium]
MTAEPMGHTLVRDPMYQQLNAALRELARTYRPGAKFLSERQVSDRFGVSRATANKAVSTLVVEGVLRLRKGIGTFVAAEAMAYDLQSLVSFTAKARAAGKSPTTHVLHLASLAAADAAPAVRRALKVEGDTPLYDVERLRLADDLPVILERRVFLAQPDASGAAPPAPRAASLTRADLRGSLYDLWTGRFGLDIAGADETIQAVNIDATDARTLEVAAGSAGLLVVATGYLAGGRPLWYERTLYRGDAYTFRHRTGRVVRPAVGTLVDVPTEETQTR